jgi:hypothetical protein
LQAKTSVAGVETQVGVSSDGSTTLGSSVYLGPVQIGVSTTQSPDIINSSANVNVDIHVGKISKGISIGIKPTGFLGVMAAIFVPSLAPVLAIP